MSHHAGKVKKNEWLKLFYLSNVITWRGFGKTHKKIIIQKLKERKWRRTKEEEEEEKGETAAEDEA